MSKYQEAVDAMGKMTRVFKAFEDVGAVMSAMVGLEQNQKELGEAINALNDTKAGIIAEVVKAKASLAKVKAGESAVHDEAAQKAKDIIQAAQSWADEVVAAADARLADADARVKTDQGAYEALTEQHRKALVSLASVNEALVEARSKVAGILA